MITETPCAILLSLCAAVAGNVSHLLPRPLLSVAPGGRRGAEPPPVLAGAGAACQSLSIAILQFACECKPQRSSILPECIRAVMLATGNRSLRKDGFDALQIVQCTGLDAISYLPI